MFGLCDQRAEIVWGTKITNELGIVQESVDKGGDGSSCTHQMSQRLCSKYESVQVHHLTHGDAWC